MRNGHLKLRDMKLELKHLAPYLPYGLEVIYTHTKEIGNIKNLYDIECYNDIKIGINWLNGEHIWMFKPILRPLSDLTKEELYNAGFDYQIDWLTHELEGHIKYYGSLENVIKKTDFGHVQYLISKHYDIFGLIEQDLAIDINTL